MHRRYGVLSSFLPLLSVSWRALRPKTPSHRALYNNISPLASHSLSQRLNTGLAAGMGLCFYVRPDSGGKGWGERRQQSIRADRGSVSAAGSLHANPRSAGIPQLCIRVLSATVVSAVKWWHTYLILCGKNAKQQTQCKVSCVVSSTQKYTVSVGRG